jgi:transcriptional regulator with XRE-family HTH domain
MVRGARVKPARLAEKLLEIRLALGLSQSEMLRRLGLEEQMDYKRISEFERRTTEPHLSVLLQYARVARVHMEDIVDDELDLPAKLPGNVNYKGIKHTTIRKTR